MKIALILLLFPLLADAQPATVIRASELKSAPATDAATITQLKENTAVDALERQGGWTRVKAGSAEGWVKMLSLRYTSGTRGDSGVAQVFNVARTGSSGTEVTTGVRGLDQEQLSKAQPNAAELAKLNGFAAERGAAAGFAAKGKLSATAIEYPKP
jgi:hypothetical protein